MALLLKAETKLKNHFMHQINPLILLVLPLVFQIIFGIRKIYESVKLNLTKVSVINFLLQILVSYLAFTIVSHNLRDRSNGEIRCGLPLVGMIVFELLIFGVLLTIMLIQFLIRNRMRKKLS